MIEFKIATIWQIERNTRQFQRNVQAYRQCYILTGTFKYPCDNSINILYRMSNFKRILPGKLAPVYKVKE